MYSERLKRKHLEYRDTFHIDDVFVRMSGKQRYICRAVDQDGEVVAVHFQIERVRAVAKQFFKRLLRSHGGEPQKIVTHKLQSDTEHERDLRMIYRAVSASGFVDWARTVA